MPCISASWGRRIWFAALVALVLFSYNAEAELVNQAEIELASPEDLTSSHATDHTTELDSKDFFSAPRIHDITVVGNKTIPTDAILAKLPYRVGQTFKASAAAKLIKSLYNLGYFKPTMQLFLTELSPQEVDLHIVLEEKSLVDEFCFEGNRHLKAEEIDKKIHYTDIKAIELDDLDRLNGQIRQLYAAKDYHDAFVTSKLIPTTDGHVRIQFNVQEEKPIRVREVHFRGNCNVSSKLLRSMIFTREQWLLGFLSKAGSYQPDAIEYDKYVIENYYKSRGYLHARVEKVDVDRDPCSPTHYIVTFTINEGQTYHIRDVTAEGNDLKSSDEILAYIPIRSGDLFSSERIREAIDRLRIVWGEYGYIFAENNYALEPHEDDRTVSIHFASTLGEPVECNAITISGNKKTREKVIRREIVINEGDLVTTRAMDNSKERVERLGFFDPQGGVNWKINRIDEKRADLDLDVKEIKTGRFQANFSTGGDPKNISSPTTSLKVDLTLRDSNFMGTSLKYALTGTFSTQDIEVGLNLTHPWLFNRPIIGGLDIYHRKLTYDEFKRVDNSPREHTTGAGVNIGYTTPRFGEISGLLDLGFENIRYNDLTAKIPGVNEETNKLFQQILDNRFQSGNLLALGTRAIQDHRNNPSTPSRGYLWTTALKLGIPVGSVTNSFSFLKWDADAHWYTPLINEFDLILHLHGHLGLVTQLGNYPIPYRELYHVGGPATVRGFLFGQIGPTLEGDSMGAKKAFWLNAELLFPVTKDFNIVGLVFYDGGAGWDTPKSDFIQNQALFANKFRGNSFHFRQAIGVGVKIRSPFPLSVAVGFKLDRQKGEPLSEVLFTSAVDF